MLIVRYTGKKQPKCIGSSNPEVLTKGQLYEVSKIKCDASLKLYELKGVEGVFPSELFSRVAESYDAPETQVWCRNPLDGADWHRKF